MAHFSKGKLSEEYFAYQKEYEDKYGENTAVLYQKGSFYELYGIDNEVEKIGQFHKVCDILGVQETRANKSILENNRSNCLMAGFPLQSLNKFTRLLLQNNFTCIIIKEKIKTKEKEKTVRYLDCILSPATTLDETIDVDSDNTFLMCIFLEFNNEKIIDVGFSYIDLTLGTSKIINIKTEKRCEEELVGYIKTIGPKELIIYTKDYDNTHEELVERLSLQKNIYHIYDIVDKNIFKVSYQNTFLDKIFPSHGLMSVIEYLNLEKYPSSIVSYIFLLTFAYEHNANILDRIQKPAIVKNKNVLELSHNTITQLNLIDNAGDISSKFSSLFSIINMTSTILGKRLLRERLLTPITNVKILNSRYKDIDKMMKKDEDTEFIWQKCENKLKNIRDIDRLHRKIGLKRLQPTEFLALHNSYLNIVSIIELFNNIEQNPQFEGELSYPEEAPCFTKELNTTLENFNKYVEMYQSILNLDVIGKYTMEGAMYESMFNKGVYEDLDEIEEKLKNTWKKFRKLAQSMDQLAGGESSFIKIDSTPTFGYFFTVSKGKKKLLQKLDYEFTFKDTTGQVKVFCPEISDYSSQILELQSEIKELNKEKFINFMEDVNTKYIETLKEISLFVANIDVTKSGAKLAETNKYCKPKIKSFMEEGSDTKRSYVTIEKLRHPIVEHVNRKVPFIDNDIDMKIEKGALIFGVNFAGKSIFLKSLAVSVILSQIGSFVPATSFIFYPFTKIMTKISVTDNLFKNESLFVAELKELKNMLDNSDERSIILSDEALSGTEVSSSMALAASAIMKLCKNNTNWLITSHAQKLLEIPEIKQLEDDKKLTCYHMQVIVENNQLVFKRKLIRGICSSLYGLEVAEFLNLDKEFISNALKIRRELNSEKELCFKNSKYNSAVLVHECAICKSKTNLHTHHIVYQEEFRKDNKIPFNKNIDHNLVVLCEQHHRDVHSNKIQIKGFIETGEGVKIDWK